MAAVVFPFPFPAPSPPLPLCCSPSAVFLSEFVASLRHLLYEQLFACHWISPCPRSLPPSPSAPSRYCPDIRYDKRSTPNPPTDYSEQHEGSQSPALHCTALWQSKPCINYTKRRLSRHATPPASHLHSAFVVLGLNWTTLCCARGKTN